jgi:transcriptional regulator with XRE-family HTH domain
MSNGAGARATPLRAERERAGLSQDELAARVQVSQSKISRAERGYSSFTRSERQALARALRVDVEAIFPGADAADEADR